MEDIYDVILVILLGILFLLCGIPWILLIFLVSKYFAIIVILIGILGYLLVKGAKQK